MWEVARALLSHAYQPFKALQKAEVSHPITRSPPGRIAHRQQHRVVARRSRNYSGAASNLSKLETRFEKAHHLAAVSHR